MCVSLIVITKASFQGDSVNIRTMTLECYHGMDSAFIVYAHVRNLDSTCISDNTVSFEVDNACAPMYYPQRMGTIIRKNTITPSGEVF